MDSINPPTAPIQMATAYRRTVGGPGFREIPSHLYAMIEVTRYKQCLSSFLFQSQSSNQQAPSLLRHWLCSRETVYCDNMGSHYHTLPPYALPNLAPISITGNHGTGFTSVADMNSLYSPSAYLIPSTSSHHQIFEPTTASVNTPLITEYLDANNSLIPDSTKYTG
jgi:hypothetical protein